MARQRSSPQQLAALGLAGATLILIVSVNMSWLGLWLNDLTAPPLHARYPYNDFGAEVTVVRLLDTSQRYHIFDAQTQLAWEETVWGDRLPNQLRQPFVRVPWSILLLWPLAQLPYPVGFLLLSTLSVVSATIALVIWGRWARLPLPVAAAFICGTLGSLPMLRTIVLGQHSALMLLALTATVIWSLEGRDVRSGIALAAATMKPHLIILIPLGWLMQLRWRSLLAGGISLLILAAASLFIIGPGGWLDFVRIQGIFDRYFPRAEAVEQMQNWPGLLQSTLGWTGPGSEILQALLMLGMAAITIWVWWPAGRQQRTAIDLRWGVTVIASLLFSYHLHFNDLLAWAIPAAIGLRRVYSPQAGAELSLHSKRIVLALVWGAWAVPWISFFAQKMRLGLWFMLIAGFVMMMQIWSNSATRRAEVQAA